MTLTIAGSSPLEVINFHLYYFESASAVTLMLGVKRVAVQKSELNSHTMDMFDRPVVYVSPTQRALMPQAFLALPGLSDFLNACSLLVPNELLPEEVTAAEKQEHCYDTKAGISLIEKASKKNFAFAVFVMGLIYETGKSVKVDDRKAISHYKKAASMNICVAEFLLGLRIYDRASESMSSKASINTTQGMVWLERAAKRGFAEAQFFLAKGYEYGDFVEQDTDSAFDWFQQAARQGHAGAQKIVGDFYYYGRNGLVRNVSLARSWYTKAVNQNDIEALYQLGVTYEDEKDFFQAMMWYAEPVKQGYAPALHRLGVIYENGLCFAADIARALGLYKQAAEQGCLEAQLCLASCYHHGKGVSKNLTQAMVLYQKAIDQGSHEAQVSLAEIKAALDQEKKAAQAKLQGPFKAKFKTLMKPIKENQPRYEMLQSKWQEVMTSSLEIKSFKKIKDIQHAVKNGNLITGSLLNELKSLSEDFSAALKSAEKDLKKAEKAQEKAKRQAEKAAKRASRRLEAAPMPVDMPAYPAYVEPESITKSVKAQLAEAEAAKERRKSITLERRLSRTISRSSLKLDYQQTQEAFAKEKEKNEQRKSQRLSKLYTKEELIAQGILPTETAAEPVITYGRIASFTKEVLKIYEGQIDIGPYTEMVKNCLHEFADTQNYEAFKKAHSFEILENGLGNLVNVNHLKSWQAKGYPICSLRVTDAIPERIVFAWSNEEKKAYQVTWVDYH